MADKQLKLDVHLDTDDSISTTLAMSNIFIEFAYWIKDVGPMNVGEQGEIGLASGMMKWRVIE